MWFAWWVWNSRYLDFELWLEFTVGWEGLAFELGLADLLVDGFFLTMGGVVAAWLHW